MTAVTFYTLGSGYWSNVAKSVSIVDMKLGWVNEERDFGELRVYFDTATWGVADDGLIYTDPMFMVHLRRFLDLYGLPGDDVSYSEQGMQGDNYVSLDIGKPFLTAWSLKFELDSLGN